MIKIIRTALQDSYLLGSLHDAKKRLEEMTEQVERQERLRFDSKILARMKPALLDLFRAKCAYCESLMGATSRAEVENFRPKGGARGLNRDQYAPMHYWWLAYDWDNLLIACQICNQKYKRDYFPLEDESLRARIGARGGELLEERPLLIDPTKEDPSKHIGFQRDGRAIDLSQRGSVTIEIIGLNRPELVDSRKRIASQVETKLLGLRQRRDLSDRFAQDFLAEIQDLLSDSPSQEYVAIQRIVLNEWREQNTLAWNKTIEPLLKRARANDPENFKSWIQSEATSTLPASNTVTSTRADEDVAITRQLSQLKRFSIKSIEIKNFKSIRDLSLSLSPSNEADGRESWLLLLGDNGIGKSSILQAIALALSTQNQLSKLNLDAQRFLRRGETSGYVKIQSFEQSEPIVLNFDENGFSSSLEEAPAFVLAYGSTRLLPKGHIEPESNREPYLNVANLFDYSVALRDPHEWLMNVDSVEFQDRVAPAFFDVLALRGRDRVHVDNGKLNIEQFGENHELENNSDGFKTITALVSDIMQTLSIEKANYHNSYGIVLIDEIGNHLHPRWRIKIAAALRRAFPKLQFIVTTHEPLCLRGLAHGEVAVLVRDQSDDVRALRGDLLPDHNLLRIDQLLTSDLFGLINVYDEETEKTYEQYYELLSKPVAERTDDENKKIQNLTEHLSQREVLGSTPATQAMFEFVNQTYAQKLRDEGFKVRDELKKETIAEVKRLINKKDINWL